MKKRSCRTIKPQFSGNRLAGASWEGYVIQQIIANLPAGIHPFFFRTRDGSELDLVLVKGNQPFRTVEVKFSDTPKLSKGNRLAIAAVGAPLNLIVTPSEGDYPVEENLRVCDLSNLWKYLLDE